jgi:hypothetical protein
MQRLARRVGLGLVGFLVAFTVLCSAGAGVGRFQVAPVEARGAHTGIGHNSLALVVPVSTARLREGDVVRATVDGEDADAFYKVSAIDSWSRGIFVTNRQGKLVQLHLHNTVGRVSQVVPYAGAPFRLLIGTPQVIAMLLFATLLLVHASRQRKLIVPELSTWHARVADTLAGSRARGDRARRRALALLRREVVYASAPVAPRKRFGPWWWTRLGAMVVWAVGVLSLTASANFTGTSTVNQGALSSAHMALTAPGAGATNRLTLAGTNIAPGDLMQRAIDISVDGATTSGAMTGMTLQVTAPSVTSNLDSNDASGLQLWVMSCSNAWTESGTTPGYKYVCSGTTKEVLGSNLPTPADPVTSYTCPPASATVKGLNTMKTAQTLNNLPTLNANTTVHLVVFMCFPGATGDSYQDLQSQLQFTFAGVQRSGTNQ